MTAMLCFHTAGSTYCMPVKATRAVRTTTGMRILPAARPDVAGIVPGDPPLTVISPLGGAGGQIIVVQTADQTFGLLVDEVTGLRQIDAADICRAPAGQQHAMVSGTIDADGELVLIADPVALAARL